MESYTESSYPSSEDVQYDTELDRSSGQGHGVIERIEVIEDSAVVKALWISIAISGSILGICVLVYVVLKLNLLPKRRRSRSSNSSRPENHQLTSRESCTSNTNPQAYIISEEHAEAYTHAGFVHDEDIKSKCLEKLQQVWYVPRNFMDIPSQDEEEVELLARGKFGPVYLSRMRTNSSPVTLFSIPASNFKSAEKDEESEINTIIEDPENLFYDLEQLIRLDKHENVVQLMGFMEDKDSMLFAVEYGGIPLKELLLQNRQHENKSNITSYSLLLCAMNIAEGMFHLHSYQPFTHGQLAACNVLITDMEVPKITGFGLLSSNSLTETHDYTRWSAVEQFQNRCVRSCDIWAFGVTLWEIATLGATPYHDIRNEDFSKKICIGSRPNQSEFISDALYQIMLYCWQLDRDERPDFSRLSCSIHELLPHSKDNLFISQSFNYPPYIHQYEYHKK